MYVQTDSNGRILVTVSQEEYTDETYIAFEFPSDFDYAKQNEYRIANGELVHDPLPEPAERQIAALKQQLANTDYVAFKIYESMVTGYSLSDDEATRYGEILEQRRTWREKINELEAQK